MTQLELIILIMTFVFLFFGIIFLGKLARTILNKFGFMDSSLYGRFAYRLYKRKYK